MELYPHEINEDMDIDVFREVAGLSRQEAARILVKCFNLQEKAAGRMEKFGVSTPWQAIIQIRLRNYESIPADPQVLPDHRWTYNLQLLEKAAEQIVKTGLATMSSCSQAGRMLDILGQQDASDFVATRDNINQENPDPDFPAPVITASLQCRLSSRQEQPYADQLLLSLRKQFGGHAVKKAEE
jgi:hypothetical protein